MLALDALFDQLDRAIMHGNLHRRFAVEAANHYSSQKRIHDTVKFDQLLAIRRAEVGFLLLSGSAIPVNQNFHRPGPFSFAGADSAPVGYSLLPGIYSSRTSYSNL
jgi:hypothetical protein